MTQDKKSGSPKPLSPDMAAEDGNDKATSMQSLQGQQVGHGHYDVTHVLGQQPYAQKPVSTAQAHLQLMHTVSVAIATL